MHVCEPFISNGLQEGGRENERAESKKRKSYSALVEIVLGDDSTHGIDLASLYCFLSSESYTSHPEHIIGAVCEIKVYCVHLAVEQYLITSK